MWIQVMEMLQQALIYFVGFIKTNSFPQPLSKDEEERCLKLLKEKDHDARNLLIEHNLRLVAHIVKKFDVQKELPEDLISVGTIGLIKGIDSFDLDKGHKLTTYISRCIENEILMHLRNSKKAYKTLSLNDPIGQDKDGSEICLIDVIGDDTQINVIDKITTEENIARLMNYFTLLDEREKSILAKRYGLFNQEVMTQREIARQEKISRSYVSRIEKRAFMKLLRAFMKDPDVKK